MEGGKRADIGIVMSKYLKHVQIYFTQVVWVPSLGAMFFPNQQQITPLFPAA
jgi:hypothetical protein